jgi:DNA-directed RNA polymerase subunit RPC12/RpoP
MSRNCEWFAGGTENGFEIKNVKGYLKWKETLADDLKALLHDKKDKEGLYVYVGIRWDKEPLDKLDTYINHGHPNGDGWDEGNLLEIWSGLSLFTKEDIDLFQTDEEFPFLTKIFGYDGKTDGGMYRVHASEGNVIVQELDFKVIKEYKHKKEDLIEEDKLEFIQKEDEVLCDRCNSKIDFKFKFQDRGYYEQIHKKYPEFKKICEKCYKELKIPFAEIQKIENEIYNKQQELDKLKKGDKDYGE